LSWGFGGVPLRSRGDSPGKTRTHGSQKLLALKNCHREPRRIPNLHRLSQRKKRESRRKGHLSQTQRALNIFLRNEARTHAPYDLEASRQARNGFLGVLTFADLFKAEKKISLKPKGGGL